MKSPFVFGATVSSDAFTNRTSESARLYQNLINGINTIIISPRRWGKSSLVEHVLKKVKDDDNEILQVHLDLFAIHSEDEFLQEFARKVLLAVSREWEDWSRNLGEIFQKLIPRVVLSTDMGDFGLEFNVQDLQRHKEEILNLPESLCRKRKTTMIICLDEFQNIRNYQNGAQLEKTMRSYWQRHKEVTYCLYGSKRHMMQEIFDNSSNPFYRFGDILMLSRISATDWVDFIEKKFRETKKKIKPAVAREIVDLADRHSWYVQQLAHFTWIRSNPVAKEEAVLMAFTEIADSQKPFFQLIIDKLSRTQINLLKALLADEEQLTSRKVMSKYGIGTPNNVRKNLTRLQHEDIVDKTDGRYLFLDPIFKYWLEKTY